MKKEVRLLRDKSVESLILSVELFNRPFDNGRNHGVLILLDHAFEMLLKSSIIHRGGKIRGKREKQTIGFDSCVGICLSESAVAFLTKEQALTLQMINSLRDAAQHHLLDISEQHLYIQAQAGLSLFRDIFSKVFAEDIHNYIPSRVLPISTTPPIDLVNLFANETREIQKLLSPGSRHRTEAEAKLRALAIVEKSVNGEKVQPGTTELKKLARDISRGKRNWEEIFPGVATIKFTSTGVGPSLDLRISKTGVPIQVVPQGTPGATVVAIKRVDDLGYYNLGRDQLAEKVGLTPPKTTAVIRGLNLKADSECYKQVTIGKAKFARYSQKAIFKIQEALKTKSAEQFWQEYRDLGSIL